MSSGFYHPRETMDAFSANLSQQDIKPVKVPWSLGTDMRDSVLSVFCLIQDGDTKPTHNSNTITGQQREAICPCSSDPELKLRHWGPMKGNRNEGEIATTITMGCLKLGGWLINLNIFWMLKGLQAQQMLYP